MVNVDRVGSLDFMPFCSRGKCRVVARFVAKARVCRVESRYNLGCRFGLSLQDCCFGQDGRCCRGLYVESTHGCEKAGRTGGSARKCC